MKFPSRMLSFRAALLACAVLACAAPSAHAVHWPQFGGDPGRSGFQPTDQGATPVEFRYAKTGAAVKTSPLITSGTPASQRLIYGTADGRVHFHALADGRDIASVDVSDDPDAFGTGGGPGSVSFADTSTEAGLGQLFAVHNDGGNLDIAHFDEAGGALVRERQVPGSGGMAIESSLVASPPAADGSRDLFFVAGGRLFKIPVSDAQRPSADIGTATRTADVNANPLASPAFLYLDVLGTPTPHVAVGTTDGFLRTYRASDLAPGPAIDLSVPLGGPHSITAEEVMTPIVPVQPSGATAGPGSPVTAARFVYVAASANFSPFGPGADDTVAYKLHVTGGAFEFRYEFLPIPDTNPSPALATSQLSEPSSQDAEVLIATTTNLFLATTHDMDLTGEIDFESDLVGGVDGFEQTAAAASGGLYYVTNDRGEQIVGRLRDGKQVPSAEFSRRAENAGADDGGAGQPAVSRGFVAFGGPDGVFVYRNRDLLAPDVELTRPATGALLTGRPTVAATATDNRDVASVQFLAGGRAFCTDTTAPYECAFSPIADDVGRTVLSAIATDAAGFRSAPATRVVNVSRFAPAGVSARVSPGRDTRARHRFTTRGSVRLPAGISRAQGCRGGVVSVQVKAGRKTVSNRRANLSRSCTYRSTVSFRSRRRFGRSGRLTFRARFAGNAVIGVGRARAVTVRTR